MLGCFDSRSHRQPMRSFPDVVSLFRGRTGLGATKIFPGQAMQSLWKLIASDVELVYRAVYFIACLPKPHSVHVVIL